MTFSVVLILTWAFGIMLGCDGRQTFNIFWNSTNSIFRVDNTDDVFDVHLRDTINLICPTYNDSFLEENTEQSIIYRVSEYGYRNCELHEAKAAGQCRNPYGRSVVTLLVLEFTPSPNGLEYSPGNSYYFITTSTGLYTGLRNEEGGLCRSKNMRFRLDVKKRPKPAFPHFSTVPRIDVVSTTLSAPTANLPKTSPKVNQTPKSKPNPIDNFDLQPTPDMDLFLQKLRPRPPTSEFNSYMNVDPLWDRNSDGPGIVARSGADGTNQAFLYEIREIESDNSDDSRWLNSEAVEQSAALEQTPEKQHLIFYKIEEVDSFRSQSPLVRCSWYLLLWTGLVTRLLII